tara:strand:+ start:104 stop:1279 length:1176 start_codon:yes stop_codon:yes gene_type:complete
MNKKSISIIGGAGHVGMPLALKFAEKNYNVICIDKNEKLNNLLNKGILPYEEKGAKKLLAKSLKNKKIKFVSNFQEIQNTKYIIITVGTPVDKQKKPNMNFVFQVIKSMKKYIHSNHSIILRSTLYPGTTDQIIKKLRKERIKAKVSYCPERVAQGISIFEIENLPQIISSESNDELKKIKILFKKICKHVEILNFIEAEYSKLFSNAWRYIKFAVSNEFYMLSKIKKFDFDKVYKAMTFNYPRNAGLPKQGFAAGPCLPKDSIQLYQSCPEYSKLSKNAYAINQSMPKFLIDIVKKTMKLNNKNVGVLGTTFKSGIDDERNSLSIDLIKNLKKEKAKVYFYDPYTLSENQASLKIIMEKCKVIFIGTPHPEFKKINFKKKIVIDCWNFIN